MRGSLVASTFAHQVNNDATLPAWSEAYDPAAPVRGSHGQALHIYAASNMQSTACSWT